MAQVAKVIPGLVGYIARCYDEIPAKAIYKTDSGERRVIECKSGVQEENGMGPPLFCFVIIPTVSKLRPKYEPLGVRIEACAMKKITEGGADKLARMLAHMRDKQVAHVVTSQSLTQRSGYIERGVDHKLAKKACERLDKDVMCVLEASMGLRDTEDEEEFFQQDHQPNVYKLNPYQQAQARLSTKAGGPGLGSAVMQRFSASLGNLIGTLPEVKASLRAPLGESVKEKILSGTVLVERMGEDQ